MVAIEVNNQLSDRFSIDEVKEILERGVRALTERGILAQEKSVKLSVALIDEQKMLELNQQYRKQDCSTDVLSFCYDDSDESLEGEIVLAPAVIEKYAQEDGNEFQRELKKNLIHGLLHIAGFEHSDEMFSLQEALLN